MPEYVINCADCGREVRAGSATAMRCRTCQQQRKLLLARMRRQTNRVPELTLVRTCETCGETFRAASTQRRFCDDCKRKKKTALECIRQKRRVNHITCRDCGEIFETRATNVVQCSTCRTTESAEEKRAAMALRQLEQQQSRRIDVDPYERATFRASSLAEAEATQHIYGGPGRAEARENALTGLAPASIFRGIRKGV